MRPGPPFLFALSSGLDLVKLAVPGAEIAPGTAFLFALGSDELDLVKLLAHPGAVRAWMGLFICHLRSFDSSVSFYLLLGTRVTGISAGRHPRRGDRASGRSDALRCGLRNTKPNIRCVYNKPFVPSRIIINSVPRFSHTFSTGVRRPCTRPWVPMRRHSGWPRTRKLGT